MAAAAAPEQPHGHHYRGPQKLLPDDPKVAFEQGGRKDGASKEGIPEENMSDGHRSAAHRENTASSKRRSVEEVKVNEARLDAHVLTGEQEGARTRKLIPGDNQVNAISPQRVSAVAAKSPVTGKPRRPRSLPDGRKLPKVRIVEPRPRRTCTIRGPNPEPILRKYWRHVLAYVFLWYAVIALTAIAQKTICWAPSPCYLPTCSEVHPRVSGNISTPGGGEEWKVGSGELKAMEYAENVDLPFWEPAESQKT